MYGILVVENGDSYQVIGEVSSHSEACELASNYERVGADEDNLAPERFVINRRGKGGWYNVHEILPSF